MTELATGGLTPRGGGGDVFSLHCGDRLLVQVWKSVSPRQPTASCYALWVYGLGGGLFNIKATPGHPLFGILHDLREVSADPWPILVDMLLDYPDTADAMRAILEAANVG